MTAGRSPVELLDTLDALRAKATPGVWRHDPRIAGTGVIHGSNGTAAVWTNGSVKNAACIVAEHNAVPALVAALRAVLADHREIHPDDHYCAYDGFVWPCPTYRAVAAALTEGGQAE